MRMGNSMSSRWAINPLLAAAAVLLSAPAYAAPRHKGFIYYGLHLGMADAKLAKAFPNARHEAANGVHRIAGVDIKSTGGLFSLSAETAQGKVVFLEFTLTGQCRVLLERFRLSNGDPRREKISQSDVGWALWSKNEEMMILDCRGAAGDGFQRVRVARDIKKLEGEP
jgi:hypothetical protein